MHLPYREAGQFSMKTDEMKTIVDALKELNESYVDLLQAVKGAIKVVKPARKMWRVGNESRLLKLGLALIVFPEPTPISETIGTCLMAAGALQKAIRSRAIYVEDCTKPFRIH